MRRSISRMSDRGLRIGETLTPLHSDGESDTKITKALVI
jgi:hypothetical protein